MTEGELRQMLKENGGWTLSRKTSKRNKYYHAVRRVPKSEGMEDVYLGPVIKLGQLSKADIVAKLERSAKQQ